jgi:hypothetical protein
MNEQQRAAVRQALDALEVVWREHKAIDGLRQLLEQPEPVQEPRGYQWFDTAVFRKQLPENADVSAWHPLYTTPPAQPADYDRSIHSNPDARVWAEFFVATAKEQKWCIDDIDEGLMIGWFANAMMAMHDHVKREEKGGA